MSDKSTARSRILLPRTSDSLGSEYFSVLVVFSMRACFVVRLVYVIRISEILINITTLSPIHDPINGDEIPGIKLLHGTVHVLGVA